MIFSRLSLLWKILLSTSVALTALFAAVAWIVQDQVIRTAWLSVEEEVADSSQAYESLWKSRAERLKAISLILSTMSDVRAAFSTNDQATIRDTAGELWAKVSDQYGLFLVTSPQGKVIASLGGVPAASLSEGFSVVAQAAPQFPKQVSGFMSRGGSLYQIVITPVYVESPRGPLMINVLVAGYAIDSVFAQEFKKSAGGSDLLFIAGNHVIASTLSPRATPVLVQKARGAGGGQRISDGVTEYTSLRQTLLDVTGQPVGELWIFRSFASADERLSGLARSMVMIWLVALIAGLALTYLLAHKIVEPVEELDRAAAEVARQNYSLRVRTGSDDELGRLARTFNAMCESIESARGELIRQERLSTISRLSTSIVHDLRNPLAAIYGGSEMLVDTELTPSQTKRLATNIYKASRRIQEMLHDLVNVSRGKSSPAEICRLRDIVAAAVEYAPPSANILIANEVSDSIELPLERARIERVFQNLFANAVEVMPGGGTIRVRATTEGDGIAVRVSDNGPGIADDVRARLFEPFFSSGKKNGLGLGLALSRQTIRDHGGDLAVEPSATGATFLIRFPLAVAATPGR